MANPKRSFSDNVPGAWYVDDDCICCALCGEVASTVFCESADYSHHQVYRQPITPEELREAEEARDRCPVEAIGNDRVV